MENLSKLLNINNSDLAKALRLGLHGLRAELEEALKTASSDPGISVCQEVLRELNHLLSTAPRQENQIPETVLSSELPWEDVFEPVPEQENAAITGELKLIHLRDAFLTDTQLSEYLGELQLHSTNDADLWNEIQLNLLRVPATVANFWQQRAAVLAAEAGAMEDKHSLIKLPFSSDEVLYPGLEGTVPASGLCLSEKSPPASDIQGGILDGDLYFLQKVVSTCIKFIELDSSLYHALKSVDAFGVRPLNSEPDSSKYIAALIDRFRRAQAAEENPDPAVILRARIDLDEAIHSLVYLPPVDRDTSWWGKLQQECRRTLVAKARQYNVQIRPLWGHYADVCTWSKDDLELDTGGIRGEVSACLRVYAKIKNEVMLGRVLFRSLR